MDKLPDTVTLHPDEVKTKAELAWDMMLAGKHAQEICDYLGYKDSNSVTQAIREQLKVEATFFEANDRQGLLRMSLYRLDALRQAVWPAAMHGDPVSVDKALKIEQQYMKAAGTDVPDTQTSQNTVLVIGGVEADYVSKLKAMAPEVMTGQSSDHSDEEDEDA
jgi:hypothetical protein